MVMSLFMLQFCLELFCGILTYFTLDNTSHTCYVTPAVKTRIFRACCIGVNPDWRWPL